MAILPTSPVVDGSAKPDIPMCVTRIDGRVYCYDDQGNLVYIGGSRIAPGLRLLSRHPDIYVSSINNPYGAIFLNLQYGDICVGNNGMLINYDGIIGRPFFGFIVYSGSISVPIGVSNAYGNTQTIINNDGDCPCGCGYIAVLPAYIAVTWGGTFAAGETVSVKLTFNISQSGSSSISFTASKTLSATATGTQQLNINDIMATIAPAITNTSMLYTVSSVTAAAASSASSTSVTVTVQLWALVS